MADSKGENIPTPVNIENTENATKQAMDHHVELDHESFTRPGAQISEKQTFVNKKGEKVSGYAVIVDFRRLLQLSAVSSKADQKTIGIIPGVRHNINSKRFCNFIIVAKICLSINFIKHF